MKVSVVVPTLNREQPLCDTLRHFLEAETYGNRELIVIDQSDRHGAATEEFLSKHKEDMQYVRVTKKGLPSARNEGVRRSTGDIVVFVDDDVLPREGFLAAHVKRYADPTVVGVTGPALAPGDHPKSREEIGEAAFKSVSAQQLMRFDLGFPVVAQWAVGCNMSFRREVILRLGGFDEVFERAPIGDDAEFSHRAKTLGTIWYEPDAALIHLQVPSGGTRDAATEREYVRQLAFCSNYFWYRVGATRAHRWSMLWRVFRERVFNRSTSGMRMLRLAAGFGRGIWESTRIRHQPRTALSGSRND